MERVKLQSSNIASVGYEDRTRTMEIEFKSGKVYQYHKVPLRVYQEFRFSASPGAYFASHIKDKYEFTK